jgi:hypothetical protein
MYLLFGFVEVEDEVADDEDEVDDDLNRLFVAGFASIDCLVLLLLLLLLAGFEVVTFIVGGSGDGRYSFSVMSMRLEALELVVVCALAIIAAVKELLVVSPPNHMFTDEL